MVAFVKFYAFTEDLAKKVHNLATDVLKLALTDTGPAFTNTVLANISQITATNGYTSGGGTIGTPTSAVQTTGTWKLVLPDFTFTASGGAMPQFRYVVLYNSTAAGGPLIGYWDYGSEVNLASTETFTVDFDPTLGAMTIA